VRPLRTLLTEDPCLAAEILAALVRVAGVRENAAY
jgi:hypothetical protein